MERIARRKVQILRMKILLNVKARFRQSENGYCLIILRTWGAHYSAFSGDMEFFLSQKFCVRN